jgi:hypothetical protein
LRDAAGNNNRFFDLLGLGDHGDEGILGGVDHCAGVDENQVGFSWGINKLVAVLSQLPHHELAVGDIVRAAECFNEDAVGAWRLLDQRSLLELLLLIVIGFGLEGRFGFALLFECFLFANARLVFVEVEKVLGEIFQIVNLRTRGHMHYYL